MVRYFLILISFVLSLPAFSAPPSLTFKSQSLNEVVAFFNEVSPELVNTGSVEVSYCGTYDANTSLTKGTTETIGGDYVLVRGDMPTMHSYLGIESFGWNEADVFARKVTSYVKSELRQSLVVFSRIAYTVSPEGIKEEYYPAGSVIKDWRTEEYLVISGSVEQNDCD